MNNAQMELGFVTVTVCQPSQRPQRRLSRAQWWFERMRHIVDLAYDWETTPPPPPEQIWLAGTQRQIETNQETPVRRHQVHEVCE